MKEKIPKNSKTRPPAMQFYVSDWKNDNGLALCSYTVKGLWIDLICFLHEADEYGKFVLNGSILTQNEIRKLTKMSPKKFNFAWHTLTEYGIVKRQENGAYYSGRMVKDWALRSLRIAYGKQGGNPDLVNPKVNQNETSPLNQKETPSSPSSSSSSSSIINTLARDFELFYEAYPKKRSKGVAERAFKKVGVPLNVLLEALGKQKNSSDWKKENGKYIPYPASWLNARGWEDETDSEAADIYSNLPLI